MLFYVFYFGAIILNLIFLSVIVGYLYKEYVENNNLDHDNNQENEMQFEKILLNKYIGLKYLFFCSFIPYVNLFALLIHVLIIVYFMFLNNKPGKKLINDLKEVFEQFFVSFVKKIIQNF